VIKPFPTTLEVDWESRPYHLGWLLFALSPLVKGQLDKAMKIGKDVPAFVKGG